MKKNYGIELKPRAGPVRPAPMDLSGGPGRRIVMAAVKRVMVTHATTLKFLSQRWQLSVAYRLRQRPYDARRTQMRLRKFGAIFSENCALVRGTICFRKQSPDY